VHEGANDGDHPAPPPLGVIMPAQQSPRLHLRTAVRLDGHSVALVSIIAGFRAILLERRVVNRGGAASHANRIQQRPGARTGHRHRGRPEDTLGGYPVPVSSPHAMITHIGVACDDGRSRIIADMLLICRSRRFFYAFLPRGSCMPTTRQYTCSRVLR